MKKLTSIHWMALTICFFSAVAGMAQTQTVTLTATGVQTNSFSLSTNQIITVNSFIQSPSNLGNGYGPEGSAIIAFNSGLKSQIGSYNFGLSSYPNGGVVMTSSAAFTGVTNISVAAINYGAVVALTLTITTPTVQSAVPANTVVFPTDAIGPVQIVLESSSDLVNWTSSMPGTYGSTYTNRFFRVRAIAQ